MRKLISIFYLCIALFVQLVALHGTLHFFSDDCASKVSVRIDHTSVDEQLVECVLCDLYNHTQTLHFDIPQANALCWVEEATTTSFIYFDGAPIQTEHFVRSRGPPSVI